MKKKVIVIAVILLAALLIFLFSAHIEEKREEKSEQTNSIRPADSVEYIIVSPRCDTGTITVYAEDGRVFQYRGKIKIKNSGWNGKKIEIVAYTEESTYTKGAAVGE